MKLALSLVAAGTPVAGLAAQVVAGGDGGSFTNLIVANNSGRATTEFWDNNSADNNGANHSCNIGFFASGTLGTSPACLNETAGTSANQGGFSYYWGDDAANGAGTARDPSSFMFSGAFSYNVSLIGAISGRSSEVGWFTLNNAGGYTFNPIALWGTKVLGTTVLIPTQALGTNWGFYIANNFNPNTGGCKGTGSGCSNATGGFGSIPFQQFALFSNGLRGGAARFLVGAEDNALEVLPNGNFRDSDYQDYIFSISYAPEPMTMGLLATGLVGLAGAGLVRRRRKDRQV